MRWVIVGCGYVGQRLARALSGEPVVALGRAQADAYHPESIDLRVGDLVVDSVPGDPERGLHVPDLAAAAQRAGVARIVYLSATSVYGPGDGGWVDEATPVGPTSARGEARLAEEDALRRSGVPGVSLRIAAIYGPGRGLQERIRAGAHRVYGAGQTYLSRIHVDDLVSAIVAAGRAPTPSPVYVVGDDEPSTAREVADGVAALWGVPPPPSVAMEEASPALAEMLLSNRRIRNARMKAELGVILRYPSWREGMEAILLDERTRRD